jgi:hypothetical protein
MEQNSFCRASCAWKAFRVGNLTSDQLVIVPSKLKKAQGSQDKHLGAFFFIGEISPKSGIKI